MSQSPRQIRIGAVVLLLTAICLAFVGVVGQALAEPNLGAIFAVLTGVAVALLMASVFVLVFSGSYIGDRADADTLLSRWGPYIGKTATYGLFAGGVGALLSTALPDAITEAERAAVAIPPTGWVAIAFASVGMAIGILETWRGRASGSEIDPD